MWKSCSPDMSTESVYYYLAYLVFSMSKAFHIFSEDLSITLWSMIFPLFQFERWDWSWQIVICLRLLSECMRGDMSWEHFTSQLSCLFPSLYYPSKRKSDVAKGQCKWYKMKSLIYKIGSSCKKSLLSMSYANQLPCTEATLQESHSLTWMVRLLVWPSICWWMDEDLRNR